MIPSVPCPGSPVGDTSGEPPIIVEDTLTSHATNPEEESLEDLQGESDPTIAYVRMKLLYDDVSSMPRSQLTIQKLLELGRKIEQASQDYLFDHHEATVRYHQERARLDKSLLQKKLGSSSSGLNTLIKEKPRKCSPSISPNAKIDNSDQESDTSSGMLGILEDPDPTEITVRGITLAFRDMSLPKNWSGPMPKTLLRDFVAKVDRYAAISYTIISHHSRAKRASVSISWRNKKWDEWLMDDVACPEDSQAEQFISAIVLHSLTYPLTEGFATSAPSSSSSSTSFRLLPAVYRELWDELEKSRKLRDDLINRKIWAKLRTVVEGKMATNSKVCSASMNLSLISEL